MQDKVSGRVYISMREIEMLGEESEDEISWSGFGLLVVGTDNDMMDRFGSQCMKCVLMHERCFALVILSVSNDCH